jgi:cytochrome oxidase Cu insertion factor (SCO1/SenC/PrrC family)
MNRKHLLSVFFALAFTFAIFLFVDKSTSAQLKSDKAPPFTLRLLNGGEFKSSDLKGKVAVLKFVASY